MLCVCVSVCVCVRVYVQLNLDNALMRHEFLEAVIRVAVVKVC